MRRWSGLLVACALFGLAVPGWADHSTPTGVNCSDFDFQEEAQAYFEDHPGDPEGLDGPAGPATGAVPGLACEMLPRLGSTTTLPPSTTTTTVPTTTFPTDAPAAILSGASGQVSGERSSFCWPRGGIVQCLHVDFFDEGPDPAETLTVTEGETLTLRFEPALAVATLSAVSRRGPGLQLAVPASNPSRFPVDLPPGTHVIDVHATFRDVPGGSATYHFELSVTPATTVPPEQPERPRIALVG